MLKDSSHIIFAIRLQFSEGDRVLGQGRAETKYSVTSTKPKPAELKFVEKYLKAGFDLTSVTKLLFLTQNQEV